MNRNRGCDKSTPPGRKSVARALGARATLFNRPSQASRARLGPCPPMPRHRVPVPGGADQPRLFCSSTWFYFPRQTNGQRTLGKGLSQPSVRAGTADKPCLCAAVCVAASPMFAGFRSALRPSGAFAAASCCRAISSTTARPALMRSALVRHERTALCSHSMPAPSSACGGSRRPFHAGAPARLARQRGSPPGGGGRRRRRWWCRGPCSSATSRRTKPRPYTSTPF